MINHIKISKNIQIPVEEIEKLNLASKIENRSRSSFIVDSAVKKANEILKINVLEAPIKNKTG